MKARKPLCDSCNIDGDCCCQSSQEKCNKCGMESVVSYNAKINTRGQNRNNPEYVEFMQDRGSA